MNEKIAQLYKLGDPRELKGDKNSIGWNDCLQYGFTEDDIPELIKLLNNGVLNQSEDQMEAWIPLYAWRTLGQLKAVEAIEPLIACFNDSANIHDDWVATEIPEALGMIGAMAIEPLSALLFDNKKKEYSHIMTMESLTEIVKYYPETRDDIFEKFHCHITNPNCERHDFNGFIIASLIDLKAVELIDDIRNMFKQGCVAEGIAGDLEDVEIELGLRKERETPRPKYNQLPGGLELSDILENLHRNELLPSRSPALVEQQTLETYVRNEPKVGRNEPCLCGSGKKYKKCCLL